MRFGSIIGNSDPNKLQFIYRTILLKEDAMKKWVCLMVLLLFGVGMAFGSAPGETPTTGTSSAAGVSGDLAGTGTGKAGWYTTIAAYTKATGNTIDSFDEAPMLK